MKYELHVWCRKNDVSRDGGLHAQCEASTDEEAIEKFRKPEISHFLRLAYDMVYYTVRCGDRVVVKWMWGKARECLGCKRKGNEFSSCNS